MSEVVHVEAAIQAAQTAAVRIAGELTFESVSEARHRLYALIDAGCRHLIIDLSWLDFCDSTGLGLLLQVRRPRRAGGAARSRRPAAPHPGHHRSRGAFRVRRAGHRPPRLAGEQEPGARANAA